MTRRAFTLVELLVVVAIVALLVGLLAPELSVARSHARSALCRQNLRQLAGAFRGAAGLAKLPDAYPEGRIWPAVPMNALSKSGVYKCPEADIQIASVNGYQVRSEEGFYIDFIDGVRNVDCCIIEARGDGYADYSFEDLGMDHSDKDYRDIVIRIYDGPPGKGRVIFEDTGYADSLCYQKQVVPGFEDLRNNVHPKEPNEFMLGGGETNYGINAAAHAVQPRPQTIVLLDYDRLVANNAEDMQKHLADSARHRRRLNVLRADDSVTGHGPMELDPDVRPDWWSP